MNLGRILSRIVLALTVVLSSQAVAIGAPLSIDQYVLLIQQAAAKTSLDESADAVVKKEVIEQVDPSDPVAQFNLGTALMRAKAHFLAVRVLTRATDLAPQNALAYGNLGESSFWIGRCDIAIPAFGRALALAPEHPDAWFWNSDAGRCYIHVRDFENAVRVCSRALELKQNSPRVELCQAKAHFGGGQYEAALTGFLRVYKSKEPPLASHAFYGALVSLEKLQRLHEAIDLLNLDTKLYSSPAELEESAAYARQYIEQLGARDWWQY